MSIMRQVVGNTVIEWDEVKPLRWEMRETLGEGKHVKEVCHTVDLTALTAGYSSTFLLALKEALINQRYKMNLKTIKRQGIMLRRQLLVCQDYFANVCAQASIAQIVFDRIDSNFLLGLTAIKSKVPEEYLVRLKGFYNEQRHNLLLFSPDVHLCDFPTGSGDKRVAKRRKLVIAGAFSRSVLVEILKVTEAAFELGKLNLARYAFSRLMLSRAARPETYRVLRCKDLRVDISGGTKSYFLTMTIPKAGTATPPQATVSIHREVGQLLEKQREEVVRRLGHLLAVKNAAFSKGETESFLYTVGDLPLFPTSQVIHASTVDRLGMVANSTRFISAYVYPLKKLIGRKLTLTAMRHTMATQLAIAGCSAATIGAILLHSDATTAQVYVDLIFDGAIDELSDSMEDAFNEHFPVYKDFVSAKDSMDPESRIVSCSADRTRHEITGKCGRRRVCEYAPLSCYDCHRFKPAYDVDHGINLDFATEEIESARRAGLQRQTDVKRYTHIANRIRIVINVCELKRAAVELECAGSGA